MARMASPPPDGPAQQAERISDVLITRAKQRIEDRSAGRALSMEFEFLNEGIALGDVENSLERLEAMLLTLRRFPSLGVPCLRDDEGLIPIDRYATFPNVAIDPQRFALLGNL